jgi:hypothetical protein
MMTIDPDSHAIPLSNPQPKASTDPYSGDPIEDGGHDGGVRPRSLDVFVDDGDRRAAAARLIDPGAPPSGSEQ